MKRTRIDGQLSADEYHMNSENDNSQAVSFITPLTYRPPHVSSSCNEC